MIKTILGKVRDTLRDIAQDPMFGALLIVIGAKCLASFVEKQGEELIELSGKVRVLTAAEDSTPPVAAAEPYPAAQDLDPLDKAQAVSAE